MAEIGRRQWDHSTDAPRLARWWLGDLLRSYGLEHELHDVVLLASELATNAIVHATSGFEIVVGLLDGRLRIEISDSDPGVPQVQYVPAGATSGRGLLIVDTLSDAWGVTADEGGGKTVWFEVAADEP